MEEQQKVYFFAYAEEADQISQLYNYLVEKGAKLEPLSDDRFENILQIIKGSKVLAQHPGEDLEEVFNSILSVIIGFAPEDAFRLIQEWGNIVLSDAFAGTGWQSHAGFAVVVFSNLFHFYEADSRMKLYLFKVLLSLSGKAKVTKALDLSSSTIENYFADWDLTNNEKIEVLRILHLALLADNRGRDAADVMIRLLKTYSDADAAQVAPDAYECVRTAIVDPQTFSFDHLLRIKAIQQLEKSKPLLFQLLKIFSHGSLDDYNKFIKDHPKFVKDDLKYDDAALLKKIKILTLITISEVNKNLSYETLKKELNIGTDDDLEKFMIDVLQSKAVIGKLNGVKKEFNVTATEKRAFDRKEWMKLRNNLGNLLENLKQIKKNIDIVTVPQPDELLFQA